MDCACHENHAAPEIPTDWPEHWTDQDKVEIRKAFAVIGYSGHEERLMFYMAHELAKQGATIHQFHQYAIEMKDNANRQAIAFVKLQHLLSLFNKILSKVQPKTGEGTFLAVCRLFFMLLPIASICLLFTVPIRIYYKIRIWRYKSRHTQWFNVWLAQRRLRPAKSD